MTSHHRICLLILAIPLAGHAADPGAINFSRDVLPILSDNCFQCHGPDVKARKAKLRLDTQEGAHSVLFPGKSAESELIRRISSTESDIVMPPVKSTRKLSPAQVALLKRWIDEGAKWGKHWAFEKPQRPPLPQIRNTKHDIQNPIDSLILSRLESEGLTLSPQAGKESLLRRVTLDLTGLPPTSHEIDAFLVDNSPNAYERVVDRLLASPQYGERMVWEWLDAARYADSNGYQGDGERTMWPWRDWAVDALNRNLPFDQFTVWQLAGDLLPNATQEQKLATGFCRNHMINGEGGRIAEENRVDYVMDMAETTGSVWLGLTFNCCRCHDHKFDPLSQHDYYSLFSFFNQTPINGGGGSPQTPPVLEILSREQQTKLDSLNAAHHAAAKEVADSEKKLPAITDTPDLLKLTAVPPEKRSRTQFGPLEQYWGKRDPAHTALLKKLRTALEARDAVSKGVVRVMVMEDMPKPRDTFLLTRGNYEKPAEKVSAAFPAALLEKSAKPRAVNRLDLARWIVSPDNPLTARVTVNRVWQQFFGTGLVKTSEDFGVQGEKPSHPDLLDWLAVEFQRDWDVKRLHRLIVTSATYRQSSKVTAALHERDPANRLLARGPRFRLPSWMIRDQALAASGLLFRQAGGPPVKPYQPGGVWEEATFGTKRYQQDRGEALYRRSLYTFWRRIIGPTAFFDTAPRQTCIVKPTRTNSPLHALTTLNDVTFAEAARALAERVLNAGPPDQRIEFAFRAVLARQPTVAEKQVLTAALARVRREFAADPIAAKKFLAVGESKRDDKLDAIEHAALAAVCSAILNLDETLTKE